MMITLTGSAGSRIDVSWLISDSSDSELESSLAPSVMITTELNHAGSHFSSAYVQAASVVSMTPVPPPGNVRSGVWARLVSGVTVRGRTRK